MKDRLYSSCNEPETKAKETSDIFLSWLSLFIKNKEKIFMCLQILLMPSFMVHQYYISRKRDVKSDICIRIKKTLTLTSRCGVAKQVNIYEAQCQNVSKEKN